MRVVNAPVSNAPVLNAPVLNAMTVDVEDYFHVQAFAGTIDPSSWDSLPCRVEANTDRLLEQFDRAGVHATMFTLGWVAERYPALIRRIVAGGHELASHGHGHANLDRLTPESFRADISRAKGLLEDAGGVAVTGYRAPTFSIGPRTQWAYAVLEETGHLYSSSVYPVRHDLYGSPDAPRFAHRPEGTKICEIPMTTIPVGGHRLPCSGGGFFRLLPYRLFRMGLGRFNRSEHASGIFYIHPWEFDPGQPRVAGAPWRSRVRHYLNLDKTAGRLNWLIRDFAWDRMDKVFAGVISQG